MGKLTHSIPDLKKRLEQENVNLIKIGVTDLEGTLRGKCISRKKFLSGLDHGLAICSELLGADRENIPFNDQKHTGWHTGFEDAPLALLPHTLRTLPDKYNTVVCLAEFSQKYRSLCPRSLLRSVCDWADSLGFYPYSGVELEFSIFNETPESIRQKQFKQPTPITPYSNGYSTLESSVSEAFHDEVITFFNHLDIPIESLHKETGAGFMEAALSANHALTSADHAVLFKSFVKNIAVKQHLLASFMAKWNSEEQGQSSHIHFSLQDKDRRSVFFDAGKQHNISDTMRHFIGGQQKLMAEFLVLLAPTVNSYKRLCPGYWAPTWGSWGLDNRTVALRIVGNSIDTIRVEYRTAGADCNPYLSMAAALASGLWGIENSIEPLEMHSGNSYESPAPDGFVFPVSLSQAANKFASSAVASDIFGKDFVEHFAATRIEEEEKFNTQVTDWELKRYFESC